jgi:hypothetical protein
MFLHIIMLRNDVSDFSFLPFTFSLMLMMSFIFVVIQKQGTDSQLPFIPVVRDNTYGLIPSVRNSNKGVLNNVLSS